VSRWLWGHDCIKEAPRSNSFAVVEGGEEEEEEEEEEDTKPLRHESVNPRGWVAVFFISLAVC